MPRGPEVSTERRFPSITADVSCREREAPEESLAQGQSHPDWMRGLMAVPRAVAARFTG